MMNTGEVANLLGIHVSTVRRWSDRGILEVYRIGPRVATGDSGGGTLSNLLRGGQQRARRAKSSR